MIREAKTEMARLRDNRNKIQHIATGFLLKPGLTCIAFDMKRGVVLAVQVGAFEPYVTWKYDFDQDKMEYVFWAGHYFQRIENAANDFRERA